MKKVAIVQSNYIPWKGYFDLIASVDEFILYDDMQYTKRDWRNRNQIKTPQGLKWLSVPVLVKGRYFQKICETKIDGNKWAIDHWKTLEQNYKRSACFNEISEWLEPIYLSENFSYLSSLNERLIKEICFFLGIDTKISRSSDYLLIGDKSERLANLCFQAKASEYISGPSAMGYLDQSVFDNLGIEVSWFDYSGYPQYTQLWGDFHHHVSILDLLFNCGAVSKDYIQHLQKN